MANTQVNVVINAPPPSGQTGFTTMTEQNKTLQDAMKRSESQVLEMTTAVDRFGKSSADAFAGMTSGLQRAGAQVELLTSKLERAASAMERLGSGGAGIGSSGFGGGMGGGGGGSRGMSRLRRMGGRAVGMGPFAGMLGMGLGGAMMGAAGTVGKDWLMDTLGMPNEQEQHRQQADIMANQKNAFHTEQMTQQAGDIAFNASQPLTARVAFDPFGKTQQSDLLKAQLANLDAQRNRIGDRALNLGSDARLAELRASGFAFKAANLVGQNTTNVFGRDIDTNALTGQFGKSAQFRQDLEGARGGMSTELAKSVELRKQEAAANKQGLEIDAQRVKMQKELSQAIMEQVKDKKAAFANLDAGQQREAIDLAKKFKEGNVGGADLEAAEHLGIFREDISRQRMKEVTDSGAFAEFAKASGLDAQEMQAVKLQQQAQKLGNNINANVVLDSDEVARKIQEGMGPIIKKIEFIGKRQGDLENAQRWAQGGGRAAQDAAAN